MGKRLCSIEVMVGDEASADLMVSPSVLKDMLSAERLTWEDSDDFYADLIVRDINTREQLRLRVARVRFNGAPEDWNGEEVPRKWAEGLPPLSELWEPWPDAPSRPPEA
jgi:hypothetical protein